MINGEMEKSRGALSRNYFYIKVEDYAKIYNRDASKELDPDSVQTKILVYEDRVNTWFLDILEEIKNTPDAGLMVLQTLAALLDNNHKLTGAGGFAATAKKLFNVDAGNLQDFIKTGSPKGMRFDLHAPAMKKVEGTFVINPEKFLDAVRSDFDRFFRSLQSNATMRTTFNRNFRLL